MKLKRKNIMLGQPHISKLSRIKKKQGTSHSESVRRGIDLLPEQGSGTQGEINISRIKKEEKKAENREVEREDKKD